MNRDCHTPKENLLKSQKGRKTPNYRSIAVRNSGYWIKVYWDEGHLNDSQMEKMCRYLEQRQVEKEKIKIRSSRNNGPIDTICAYVSLRGWTNIRQIVTGFKSPYVHTSHVDEACMQGGVTLSQLLSQLSEQKGA